MRYEVALTPMSVWFQLAIIMVLVGVNGFFAMGEIAIISAKKTRLQALVDRGVKGARRALDLHNHPERLLPTVQVVMTITSVLAGAYSGATIAKPFGDYLNQFFWIAPNGEIAAMTIVVVGVTYFTVVMGELVPKQLAVKNTERVAIIAALPLHMIAKIGAPLVKLLDVSTQSIFKIFGVKLTVRESVTEEDVKGMLEEGTKSGVFIEEEEKMVKRVLRLADTSVRGMMTTRHDVDWINILDTPEQVVEKLKVAYHSIYPVCEGGLEKILGVVRSKDLLDQSLSHGRIDLQTIVHKAAILPDTTSILAALEQMRQTPVHMAIIVDEYGDFEGIITAMDILGAIVGDLPEFGELSVPIVTIRDDGSWLMDAALPIDEVKETLGLHELPGEEDFHTLAGVIMSELQRIPQEGDKVTIGDFIF
jgi:putative hemolysin